ncbi:MAG: ABC transporter permease [Bacillota bacterium]
MHKKLIDIKDKLLPLATILIVIIIWQIIAQSGVVPGYMLPAPLAVAQAFMADLSVLLGHLKVTLIEALAGLGLSIILGFMLALLMDRYETLKKAFYPLLVVTQTVPPIAIAPLLVLWFGFGLSPKILLIVVVCFFPIAVGFLHGFAAADADEMQLLRSMGANKRQIFRYIKLPSSLPYFFSGLKVSTAYCVVSAVIAEWLGGTAGLGVYMTRVRKSYDFESMFAVIILIAALSIVLMLAVTFLEKRAMPYKKTSLNYKQEVL